MKQNKDRLAYFFLTSTNLGHFYVEDFQNKVELKLYDGANVETICILEKSKLQSKEEIKANLKTGVINRCFNILNKEHWREICFYNWEGDIMLGLKKFIERFTNLKIKTRWKNGKILPMAKKLTDTSLVLLICKNNK
jgi:hypothetical protein